MTAVSIAALQAQAEQIRTETQKRNNTAQRVGQMLVNMLDSGPMGSVYNISPASSAASGRAAINAAFIAASTADGGEVVLQPGTHLIDAKVTVLSNTRLRFMPGAVLKLADGANDFALTIGAGAEKVTIIEPNIDGNKTNNPGGAAGIQTEDTLAQLIWIRGGYIHDCNAAGIYLGGSLILVEGVDSISNGVEGITGAAISYFAFLNNYAASNGTHNIGLIGVGTYGSISNNRARLSGALADNLTGYSAANAYVSWCGNVTSGGGNNGVHVGGSYITFNDNTIEDAADYGLIARNNDASAMPGFQASGNTISNSGTAAESGVWLGNLIDFVWGPNVVRGSRAHGLLIQEGCTRGSVTGGIYSNNGTSGSGSGVRIEDSTDISVTGVVPAGNASVGLRIQDSTRINVSGGGGPGNASPITVDGTSSYVTVVGYNCLGNTSDVPTLTDGCVSLWANSPNDGTLNIASASGITFPAYSDFFRVTGGSGINALTASWPQRRVTMRFAGAPLLTNNASMQVGSGVFQAAANSSISFISDGSVWWETGRKQ